MHIVTNYKMFEQPFVYWWTCWCLYTQLITHKKLWNMVFLVSNNMIFMVQVNFVSNSHCNLDSWIQNVIVKQNFTQIMQRTNNKNVVFKTIGIIEIYYVPFLFLHQALCTQIYIVLQVIALKEETRLTKTIKHKQCILFITNVSVKR